MCDLERNFGLGFSKSASSITLISSSSSSRAGARSGWKPVVLKLRRRLELMDMGAVLYCYCTVLLLYCTWSLWTWGEAVGSSGGMTAPAGLWSRSFCAAKRRVRWQEVWLQTSCLTLQTILLILLSVRLRLRLRLSSHIPENNKQSTSWLLSPVFTASVIMGINIDWIWKIRWLDVCR